MFSLCKLFSHDILALAFLNGPCQDTAGPSCPAQPPLGSPSQPCLLWDLLNGSLTHWTGPWPTDCCPVLTLLLLYPCLPRVCKAGCCHWTWPRSAEKPSRINSSRFFRTVSSWLLNSSTEGAPQGLWEICSNVRSLTGKAFPSFYTECPGLQLLLIAFCSLTGHH